jgi:hypothetical protein
MRYGRAVEKVHILAEACQRTTRLPLEEPLLHEVYVFGELLDGADSIDHLKLALVLNLPPEEVPWESQPRGTPWLVDSLRLDKGGFSYWWRSRHGPVWNHHIRGPVRFWSLDGPDDTVLRALSERRLADLPRLTASPEDVRSRTATELDAALVHLRAMTATYWDREWRRDNRGNGRYPENHLWEAVYGYVDLLDAVNSAPNAGQAP